jgi:hypothetical protein
MKLYGQDVPQSVIDAANAAMVGRFTRDTVAYATQRKWDLPVNWILAKKILQKARKAGTIRYEGGYWHEVVL